MAIIKNIKQAYDVQFQAEENGSLLIGHAKTSRMAVVYSQLLNYFNLRKQQWHLLLFSRM